MKIILRVKNHETKRYRRAHEVSFSSSSALCIDSESIPAPFLEQWVRIDSISYMNDAILVSITPPRRKKAQVAQ